ncbi:YedE family putative selenium transporter [Dehalococcoidia bacterium]|nr:YedE family putative selenium transporter [Dehalococcoidia bacterium]
MAISSRIMIILAGLIFGALGALLVEWGNPGNMGICVACFYRDIAGALGLHRVGVVQYIRPEIIGFVLGAFISAYGFREFRARGGSSPMVRFFLGAFVMIGALVFLGCPIRALLRLAGGDLNGITAVAGLILGAVIGILFLKQGFNLGRSSAAKRANGWIMPVAMLALLLLAIFPPGFIFESEKGPGATHVALWIALLAGLGGGILVQRTRMCMVGGWRDLFLIKDTHLFGGIAGFFIGAFLLNLILGHVSWGFEGQPVAHTNHLWNFLGMVLVGLGSVLLGGCPLRQTILSGEGDTDAGITVLGFFAGAAFAHNFLLASTPDGPTDFGQVAVIVGLVFAASVGFLMRDRT